MQDPTPSSRTTTPSLTLSSHINKYFIDVAATFSHLAKELIAKLPNGMGRYAPIATSLIHADARKIHNKSRLASMLASAKSHAPGAIAGPGAARQESVDVKIRSPSQAQDRRETLWTEDRKKAGV